LSIGADLGRGAAWIVKLPIRIYRYTLSPYVGHVCRFHPTCSAYALEAIDTHGAAKGFWLMVRRLARCHPIAWLGGGSGIDRVPPPSSSSPAMGRGNGGHR
jgi:hypothetical protein